MSRQTQKLLGSTDSNNTTKSKTTITTATKITRISYSTNGSEREGKKRLGEMAGGTAAEFAAVCCCCPCTAVNVLVLVAYKVPACLCKKAVKKRGSGTMRSMKKQHQTLLLSRNETSTTSSSVSDISNEELGKIMGCCDHGHAHEDQSQVVDLEKEMRNQFYGTGFWRSPSRRET